MDTFFKFLYDFLSQFFNGILDIIMGVINGVGKIFNIKAYISVIDFYKNDFTGPEWLFVVIAILLLLVFFLFHTALFPDCNTYLLFLFVQELI